MLTAARFLWCAAFLSTTAFAAELYVSPAGNDKNPGSKDAPFATITKAAAAAQAGDTVKIGPGIYREQVTFKASGTKEAPVTFAGTRGKKGEFLTIVEAPGKVLTGWTPAPEIAPDVWKTPLAKRPDLIMMNGAMIAFVNRPSMELPRWKKLPKELNENMFWGAFGPGCRRLPGFDFMSLPSDIWVSHRYFHGRKEQFWPTIGNVLAGWYKGFLYVRMAAVGALIQDQTFTASSGQGFSIYGSYITFRDLHMRGSRTQIFIKRKSTGVTVDNCLLMHGGCRVRIDPGASRVTVQNSILTAGFVRNDLFKLRSQEDMRGGLLYVIFKYLIGTSSSDDEGIYSCGSDCVFRNNLVLQGLIGISASGSGEVYGNVVREMSSIGILTTELTVGRFHDNLVMNCGIPLRLHHFRHARGKREEYHYNNVFVQARHGGDQVFVHCESYRFADKENFERVPGKRDPVYKKNPPNPVDGGKIYLYHNTFWGGRDDSPAFTVAYLSTRFRMVLPFFVINNIFKDNPRLWTTTHELAGPNVLYLMDGQFSTMARRDPEVVKLNRRLDAKSSERLWNKKDLPGLPDVSLAPDSPAIGAGVDISRPFSVRGKNYPALPGFKPGYFKGKAPAAGALQKGESARRFVEMHRKAEAAIRMLNELKKSTAERR